MNDFYEKNYFIDNIGFIQVYALNDQGQLVKTDQKMHIQLVMKIDKKIKLSKELDSGFHWEWEKEEITIYHPQALVLDTEAVSYFGEGVSYVGKNWVVDMQEIVKLYNEGRPGRGFGGYILFDDITDLKVTSRKAPASHNQFALESISDPQPDYDADFATIPSEGNGLVPAHGPVEKHQSVYLNFSPKDQSLFTYAEHKLLDVVAIPEFNKTLKNIDQDNLTVTLKSQRTDLVTAPSYKIPVLVTK